MTPGLIQTHDLQFRPWRSWRHGVSFSLLVVLLLAPWPRLGRGFVAFFGAYGNVLVGALDTGGAAPPRFGAPEPGQVSAADGGEWAVLYKAGDGVALPLDTRIIGYTPLA